MILTAKFFNKPDIIYCYGPNAYQDDMKYLKHITDQTSRKIGLILQRDMSLITEPTEYGDKNARKLVIF